MFGVKVEVWGDYALFSRPELKVERCTYEVMTPSAARGIMDSIYWHPGMSWRIDRIYVLNPIQYMNIRRNEVNKKMSASNVLTAMRGGDKDLQIITSAEIAQRAALVLRDVHYVIEAHFEMTDQANGTDNHGKFSDIIRRRLEKGSCYSQPYLGCREFTAYFQPWPKEHKIVTAYASETLDLGYMLYDMDYSDPEDIKPLFFHGVLQNGVLDLTNLEVQP
ncbi:type I-C CRISPR-associated protein Cas5c [Eubacterium sp.]|uniref:type I-C CRISPR-associated protein Cas5c n=1 Tax=Eubacterium sp. TaxID=142586 RepID=UPI002FC587C0